MGDHDKPLRVWQASVSESGSGSRLPYVYIIVGNNTDKRVIPQTMRIDNQAHSLHHFHAFAALSHVEILHLDDKANRRHQSSTPVDISTVSRR